MYVNATKLSIEAVKNIANEGKIGRCCFLSTIHALARSNFGEKILQENVKTAGKNNYVVRYGSIKGKERFYEISFEDYKKYLKRVKRKEKAKRSIDPYPAINASWNKITEIPGPFQAIAASWDKAVKQFPTLKNVVSRIVFPFDCSGEWNTASNFMKCFTGQKPTSISDKSIFPLVFHNKKAKNLLNKMQEMTNKDYSFVVGTGLDTATIQGKKLSPEHYYSVINVDNKNIILSDPVIPNEQIVLSRKDLLHNFRSICGYFKPQ